MLKKFSPTLWNTIGILMIVIIVALHFVPFFVVEGDAISVNPVADGKETLSLFSYEWLPETYPGVLDTAKSLSSDYDMLMNNIILLPNLQCLLAILALVLYIFQRKTFVAAITPVVISIIGVIMYIAVPVLRCGILWQVHLVVQVVATVVTGLVLGLHIANASKPKKK